jgi:hypothetical protein
MDTTHNHHVIAIYANSPKAGKTTVAETFAQNGNYTILSFASPLKEMLTVFLRNMGVEDTEKYFYNPKYKDAPIPGIGWHCTARHLMQTLGTEWGRKNINTSVWIASMYNRIQAAFAEGFDVIVDDMRFQNEYNMLAQFPAWMVHVSRPGAEYPSSHSSEGGLKCRPFDFYVINDKTLDDLAEKANAVHAVILEALSQ